MLDVAFLIVVLVVIAAIFLRRTSPGVAVFVLLAGVLLDQLLSNWLLSMLPTFDSQSHIWLVAAVRLSVILLPVIGALLSAKVLRRNSTLMLLTGVMLGFLVVFFTYKIIITLPLIPGSERNSALLQFINPYQNFILAASAILALIEMIKGHRAGLDKPKRVKK